MTVFDCDRYWLKNAHIPMSLIEGKTFTPQTQENLCLVDLLIIQGKIAQISQASSTIIDEPSIDLQKKLIFPCFVDLHTHLDKGHIWQRSPNKTGTFDDALATVKKDAEKLWTAEDLYRRMEFGLKCSYAHGTIAIRTHIDSYGEQASISLDVFKSLKQKWQNKITLQAVSLVSLDYYQTPEAIKLADKIAEVGGILGGVAYNNPDLDEQLDIIFRLAKERNLTLDFHVDENNDPESRCLEQVAKAAIRNQFPEQIICGHCCSLSVQPTEIVDRTLELVRQAGIGIVSLPMCNLYLQDRSSNKTPYWRGVTQAHEIKQKGIPIAFASDNCRDPFHAFGDHDGLEVFSQAIKIAHLDTPYQDWCNTLTKIPADLMGLPELGRIKEGLPANLIIFKARYFSELLSRSQRDRIVLRQGKMIDTTLPDYAELDDLLE
jgi:cytosine/creatinine deaminase